MAEKQHGKPIKPISLNRELHSCDFKTSSSLEYNESYIIIWDGEWWHMNSNTYLYAYTGKPLKIESSTELCTISKMEISFLLDESIQSKIV